MTQPDRPDSPSFEEFEERLQESPAKAAGLLVDVHPVDVATWLRDVPDEDAWHVFSTLDTERQAEVLGCAEERLRADLIQRLSADSLRQIVELLPPDDAVDLLAEADERVAEDVLHSIPIELAHELRGLIAYPPESAGGVMTTDFVTVTTGTRVGDAVKEIKKEGEDLEDEIGVFVVDADDQPVGYLTDRALLTHSIHDSVDEAMVAPFTISAGEDQEEAGNLFSKYNLQALGVIDDTGALIGVISSEDAQEIVENELREDILRLVGTAPSEQQTRLPVLTRVRQRMPLMAVTVLGGLLSAKILELFLQEGGSGGTSTILRFLPLIIGLAGNVGIQSSTILVRAFATGEVEPKRELSVLIAEVLVGMSIGVICGGLTAFFASYMDSGSLLDPTGGAVGLAIVTAVTWAAVLGCVVPMSCRRLRIDPAIVAGPFLVCLSDISGSAIYIVVARKLIGIP